MKGHLKECIKCNPTIDHFWLYHFKQHGRTKMEQNMKFFFMNLMNSFFDNNVNLKFDPNLELEMIKLPDLLSQSWLV